MLKQQNVRIQETRKNEGQVNGQLVDSTEVVMTLATQGVDNTAVSIRVGKIPDQAAAENLQRALAKRLDVNLPL